MSIDTDAPANSVTWSVVDGVTGDVIDGYYDRSGTWSDLGGIDWEIHSSIRLKVVLEAMGTGSVTKVNGIHVQGRFVNSFDDNPSDWNLVATSWDGDSIVGDGEAYSPTFLFRQPISRIASNVTVTGGGELQAAVDGGPWGVISAAGINNLDSPAHKIQLRWSGGGQQFDLLHFDVEFQGAGLPTNPRIDLSLDGSDEWSIDNESIGIWGWQNRLADGNLSKTATFPGQHNVEFWIPKDSTGDLLFEISPNSSVGVSNLEMQLLVGGNLVNSWTYGSGDESRTFRIQDSDRANFVSELTNAQPIWSEDGIEYVAAEMMLDAPGGQVTLAGLAMPHQPTATLHFEPETDFMLNFNQLTASMTASSGWKSVPISMGWETPAAMEVTLTELVSDLATEITLSQASNLSSTLSPTWQMFEISHNISVLEGELAAIRYDLEGGNEAITYTAWYGAQPLPNNTLVGDVDAVILPSEFNEGNYSVPVNSSGPGICCDVNPTFIWSLDSSWDDDDLVTLSVRSIMGDGLISLPWVHQFGVGPLQGVENDLLIRDWRVLNDLGLEVSEEASYLKMNSNITVQVDFGFEGIASIFAPRSDDIEVRLLQDGIVHALTTELIHGVATFVTTTPMTTGDVEYSVEFTPLKGGDDVTSILLNQTFEIDSVAPQVISQSVATHDHLEPSLSQTLTFELYDLPTLPTDVSLMLWREWQDDTNGNNQPDSSEFHPQSMIIPQNLSHIQGNYSFTFDDSYGLEGDRVAGYLVGSDPAGNEIIGGGSDELNSHLFIYQLMTDEAPTITREGAGWADGPRDWLHPSPTYGIVMPFEEANGFSD
ncbi:MAG: hypothetical protein H8D82_01320, partial [Euryarchaeota archaeon]|nr:hypothetical protein [Euryarchaeota archaeon]